MGIRVCGDVKEVCEVLRGLVDTKAMKKETFEYLAKKEIAKQQAQLKAYFEEVLQ